MIITCQLNGLDSTFDEPAERLLLDVVRDRSLTGTKEGCGVGVCGACTVLVDGRPTASCLTLVAMVQGRDVVTIEGARERFPGLVDAFVDHEGMQCGICTPGQVMTAAAIASRGGVVTHEVVEEYLSGTLCRCTGYQSIARAVESYFDV